MNKPGWQTTEFWLTIAAIVVPSIVASGILPDDSPWTKGLIALGAALASLGYGVSRAMVKRNGK